MFSLFFLVLTHTATAATDWQAVLREGAAAPVLFGVQLGGSEPFLLRENEEFAPASTAKLFTAGAALASLGPDYRYPTTLRWRETPGGVAAQLTLVGSGDPSWGLSELGESGRDRLDQIAAALKAAGIREVRGDIAVMASDPRWNSVRIPEGWKDSDSAGCDGALAQAFNLSLNCATYLVRSPASGAWAADGLDYPVRLSIRSANATIDIRINKAIHLTKKFIGAWRRNDRKRSGRFLSLQTAAFA